MATDRFLDSTGLRHLWEKIKAWIPFLSRKTQSIPFGQVDSTSTSTLFTATVDGIDELRDGVCCYLRNGVVSCASGWTLNINSLGAKPVYDMMYNASATTSFSASVTMLFIYNSSRIYGGCWDMYLGRTYDLSQNYISVGHIDVGNYPTGEQSLCAFDINDKLTPFVTEATTSTGKTLVSSIFPVGAKIFRDSRARTANSSFNDVTLYTTLNNIDLRYSSVNHNQAIFPNNTFNRVFMIVTVNTQNDTFTLSTQTTSGYNNNFTNERELKPNNFYIEIGFNSASGTSYNAVLLCDNPLYYYNGTNLIEYSIYKSSIIDVPDYKVEKLLTPTSGYRDSYMLEKDDSVIVGSDIINIPTEFTPLISKEYQDNTFYCNGTANWENSTRLFMSVKPDADKEYWYVKYRVRVWIPTDTDKRFTDSIIEYFGSGISMRGYRIWNTLSATTYATYYQAAYWLTAAGLSNDFAHLLGTSILYATNYTNSAWYRYVKVDLLAYEGCDIKLFDQLTKFTPYIQSIGANASTDYNTYSNYSATGLGLQETGDATDVSNMFLPYSRLTAGANGIMSRSLIMQDEYGKWQSFTTTSGTGVSKTKNTSGFRLGSHIYYCSATTDVVADARLDNSCVRVFIPLFDLRYSLNITTTAGGVNNLLPYKPLYIVGTVKKDFLFYLDDVWWTQDEPTEEDDKIYIKVAEAVYNDYENNRCYRADLLSSGHAYWYRDGAFRRYYGVGHLNTDNTSSLPVSSSESFCEYINLHKIAKTGNYNDLNNKPTIPVMPDISGKADKVTGATNGNFAGLDSSGNLTDSGYNANSFLTSQQLPVYTIVKLQTSEQGYASSYVLQKDGVQEGATINIPKDMVVENGEVKTVTTANVPYQGAVVGDKYIDLTIANSSQQHIYIPVKDLVDVYTAGNGINISQDNYISVKVDSSHSNGLGVGGDGLALYTVTPSTNGEGGTNGAMTALDKEKLDGIEAGAGVVGTLNTNNTASQQVPQTAESFGDNINLHKISKTGSYNDLNDKPTTPVVIEVTDITNIASSFIEGLKVGDVVVLRNVSMKSCYITSYKSNTVCCLTYTDNEIIQTVFYLYSNSAWSYNNTFTNDIKGNKVVLNGYTDDYGVHQYSLAAFAISDYGDSMTMTSFTTTGGTSAKTPISGLWFPIGCKIYFRDSSSALAADDDFTSETFYSTHKNVDVRYSAITGSNISLGYMNYSAVFLRVEVNNFGYWKPYSTQSSGGGVLTNTEFIVTIDQLVQDNYYIYLGRTVGTSGHIIQLEDNNNLYYFDGKGLVDWAKHVALQYYSSVQTDLSNYYTKLETYSRSEVDSLINGISNFEYVVIEPPATLPTASSSTMGVMYIYNGHRYVTIINNNVYSWYDLGSYDIDLTGYVTDAELQQALSGVATLQDLADYVTGTEFQQTLSNYPTLQYLNYYVTQLEFQSAMANRPTFQQVTEQQMQTMLDNETWVNGVLYYTIED